MFDLLLVGGAASLMVFNAFFGGNDLTPSCCLLAGFIRRVSCVG